MIVLGAGCQLGVQGLFVPVLVLVFPQPSVWVKVVPLVIVLGSGTQSCTQVPATVREFPQPSVWVKSVPLATVPGLGLQ